MTKRANGEGCLRRRVRVRRDGSSYVRYSALVTIGYSPGGKQKQLEGPTRKTRSAAFAHLDRLRKERGERLFDAYTITVGDYLDHWLSQIAPNDALSTSRRQLSAKTYRGYRGDVDNHIRPHLGTVKLRKLGHAAVQRWQNALELDKGSRVARNASATLSSALTKAVRWHLLLNSPYAGCAVERIAFLGYEADYWEPSEAKRFITADTTIRHPYFIAFYLALNLGLRISELRGLKWTDVEYHKNRASGELEPYLHIQRQATDDRLIPTFSERLKSRSSNRLIPLPGECLRLLEQHRARQAELPDLGLGTVVTNRLGGMPSNGTLREMFYALCKDAQVRKIRFHGLRHTAGSLWIEAGVSLLRTSRWLGHSSMRTTEKIYIHLLREGSSGESLSLSKLLEV